jgi:hypothetical protein
MQTLANRFTYQGRKLELVERVGLIAKYRLVAGFGTQALGYELIIVQVKPAETLFGRAYPEREAYPSSEQWGTHGWSYTNHKDSVRRMQARWAGLLRNQGSGSNIEALTALDEVTV